MNRKDIKIGDLVLVYKYECMLLGVYKVKDIFKNENDRFIFECRMMEMSSNKELKELNNKYMIHGEDVVGMFNSFN